MLSLRGNGTEDGSRIDAPRPEPVVMVLRLTRTEVCELRLALLSAMDCQTQAQMLAIATGEGAEIGRHRRTLCRFCCRLLRPDGWAEQEAEITLLRRAEMLFLAGSTRLVSGHGGAFKAMAARIRRYLARWEGDDDGLCGWG